MNVNRSLSLVTLLTSALTVAVAAQTPPVPVPRPFPGSGGGTGSGSSTTPARPAPGPATPSPAEPAPVSSQPLSPAAASTAAPTPGGDIGDVPLYPAAEYLTTVDAGMGQRYVLYGSDAAFETVVAYYRQTLKNGGREIYRAPAVQQWDLGRYQEERMAYPPSVVVKNYSTGAGYLFVKGTTQKRYRVVIQVVPPPAGVTGR